MHKKNQYYQCHLLCYVINVKDLVLLFSYSMAKCQGGLLQVPHGFEKTVKIDYTYSIKFEVILLYGKIIFFYCINF